MRSRSRRYCGRRKTLAGSGSGTQRLSDQKRRALDDAQTVVLSSGVTEPTSARVFLDRQILANIDPGQTALHTIVVTWPQSGRIVEGASGQSNVAARIVGQRQRRAATSAVAAHGYRRGAEERGRGPMPRDIGAGKPEACQRPAPHRQPPASKGAGSGEFIGALEEWARLA